VANKKSYQRYQKTSVKLKRHIPRTLNRFTVKNRFDYVEMYNVTLNSDKEIEFGEVIDFIFYMQSDIDALNKIIGINTNINDETNNIVFNTMVANKDLGSYELILQTIDNLLSINSKYKYKEALKAILQQYSQDNISFMLEDRNESIIISEIEKQFDCSNRYAKRIYNELTNRIRYRYVGLYSENDSNSKAVHTLTPKFLSSLDILKSNIDFILEREWLFNEDILEILRSKIGLEDIVFEDNIYIKLSNYFSIKIDTDLIEENSSYYDAVEFLTNLYFKEENENAPYPNIDYKSYEYHFVTEWAKEECNTQEVAIDCILAFNDDKEVNDDSNVHQWYKKSTFHPIDEEEANDITMSKEHRSSASSLGSQWNTFYDSLVDGIVSGNIEDNFYYEVHKISNELLNEYHMLEEEKVYSTNGNINENSSYLLKIRTGLVKDFKDMEVSKQQSKVTKILAIEKKRWKLLSTIIQEQTFIQAVSDFDYKRLEF